ncbi:MAG: hypothetical protein EXS16_12680 [Gemmataceae bacterium]|nr:hypothetical protein [Gemmataceae bacterium]
MTEQSKTDMRNAAAWKPMRWGLKMQIACVFVQLLGIVLAGCCIYYALNFDSARVPVGHRQRNAGISDSGFIAIIMFFIVALIGAVILPLSLFWLARIPAAARVGRWAPWGMCSLLPGGIGIVATGWAALFSKPLTAPWLILSIVAVVLLFFGMFCMSHILRATATFWNAAALGWQFPICLTALCGLIVLTFAILLAAIGNLNNEMLRQTANSYLRIWPAFPVGYLLLMSWHLVLARRLLARIPIAKRIQEPQVPIS